MRNVTMHELRTPRIGRWGESLPLSPFVSAQSSLTTPLFARGTAIHEAAQQARLATDRTAAGWSACAGSIR